MLFSSVEYLIFFPITFLLYWTFCGKSKNAQNVLLLVSSAVFYGWWDWRFLGLIFVTALTTFIAGKYIAATKNQRMRKLAMISSVILNIGILIYFKYFNFFVNSFIDLMSIFGFSASEFTLNIILPVGISFYTFTALSYVIDVYQKRIDATSDALAYFSYVLFFPSIFCGPISRADKQLPQYFERRTFDYDAAIEACKALLWGGLVKYCLADRIGIYVDAVYNNFQFHSGITLFFASVLYTIQIYADFSGYSLMAIGFGQLLGIKLQVNFIRPYFATTITDFWRRWHISLTSWFRDYIYFPLGGNRVGRWRWALNIMIVFIISGLWHGAAYSFLAWGALHGICMIIERFVYGEKLRNMGNQFSAANALRICVTFTVVSFAWIFFRAGNLDNAIDIISGIFTQMGAVFIDMNSVLLFSMTFAIVFAYDLICEYNINFKLLSSRHRMIRYATAVLLICYILAFGVLNGGSFIYFQF